MFVGTMQDIDIVYKCTVTSGLTALIRNFL